MVTFENVCYKHQKSRKMKVEASAKIHRNWFNVKTNKCKSTLSRNNLRTEKMLTSKFSGSIYMISKKDEQIKPFCYINFQL